MQLTPRDTLLQFGHLFQQDLFPHLESAVGQLTPQLQLLTAVVSMVPLGRLIDGSRAATGRPPKDRMALATAFIAKAILNLSRTRDLLDRLRVDEDLRRLCGWRTVAQLPHESKFSRAFAEFASGQLPQQLHEAVIQSTQSGRLIGHIARDSSAIGARERIAESIQVQKRASRKGKSKGKAKGKAKVKAKGKSKAPKSGRKGHPRAKASERGTRIEKQVQQKFETMVANLPQPCDMGAKATKDGDNQYWRGYKLHLDVADGQLPISAILTSASVHDSQVAIPLMTMTSRRVVYLYDLMDSAYDADTIHDYSRRLNHVPIIAVHKRRGTKRESPLKKIFPATPTPEFTWAQQDRFKERTMVERVYSRLKDEFGANKIRVRGSAKVMAHLMFGVLALTVDQWLRMGRAT